MKFINLYLITGFTALKAIAGNHGKVAFHHLLPLHKRSQSLDEYQSSVDAQQAASNSAQMAKNSAAKSSDIALQNGAATTTNAETVTSTNVIWSTITDWVTIIIRDNESPLTSISHGVKQLASGVGTTTIPETSANAPVQSAAKASGPIDTGGMTQCTSDSPCIGRITMNPYNVSTNACGNEPLSDVWDNWMTALTYDRFHAALAGEGMSSYCNAMVNIHCPSFGTTVSAKIIDCCGGGCQANNALDLSVSTFTYMTGHNDGNDGPAEQYMCHWYYA